MQIGFVCVIADSISGAMMSGNPFFIAIGSTALLISAITAGMYIYAAIKR